MAKQGTVKEQAGECEAYPSGQNDSFWYGNQADDRKKQRRRGPGGQRRRFDILVRFRRTSLEKVVHPDTHDVGL